MGVKTRELKSRTCPTFAETVMRDITTIYASPENDLLYKPVDPKDPATIVLAKSVRQYGILEPLIISSDSYIISGHRRYAAAKLVRLKEVPCRVDPVNRCDDKERFAAMLTEYNRQRVKTHDELLREAVAQCDEEQAYTSLIEHREMKSTVAVDALDMGHIRQRKQISSAKSEMVDAICRILESRRKYWPLSDRQIHYALLNDPPLRHSAKSDSRYCNDPASYKDLTDMVTRMRLTGQIPFSAIADPTRPVSVWNVHNSPQSFLNQELNGLFKGYWRDLLQSQPNHIELIAEKNTLQSVLSPVAMKYCLPFTIGRGYCSLPPRHEISERYKRSGKEKLILLIVSDFDPDGESIASSFAASMRDDFNIDNVVPMKVALTFEQTKKYKLPPSMEAKKGSKKTKSFVEKYGPNVWEVEALDPATLQQIVTEAIDSVIDRESFNFELDAEKSDAAFLAGARSRATEGLKGIDLGG